MAQITLTGKFHAAGTYYDNGTFQKQPILVEVTENGYTSYFPVDFLKDNIQKLNQVQATIGQHYTFTCFVQGSKNVSTDKNGAPAAYLNLSCTQIAPAQAPAPQAAPAAFGQPQQQQGFGQTQQPAQNFGQPAQGGIGQPQAQPFGQQPAQQPAAPAQQFGQPAQAAPAAPFGQPQTPPAFNPNAGQ